MDISAKWDVNMVMNELIQGMDQAIQLKLHLGSFSGSAESFQVQDLLLQRVMSSFENALLMLQLTGLVATTQSLPPNSGIVESSSVSMNNGAGTTTPSDDSKQIFMDNQNLTSTSSKKRKTIQMWTEQVKVSAEHGLEGPADDGYSWRKYGQKDIMGAKFPRSYYRCTYRAIRNCCATKQVQRSDQHPNVFDITYKGTHTCIKSPSPGATIQAINQQQPKQTDVIINFGTKTMESNYSSNEDAADFSFSCPSSWTWAVGENQTPNISTIADDQECFFAGKNTASSYYSPTMPEESNYFSASSWNDSLQQTETTFLQQYESELTDIISSDASPTNSFLYDISDFLF